MRHTAVCIREDGSFQGGHSPTTLRCWWRRGWWCLQVVKPPALSSSQLVKKWMGEEEVYGTASHFVCDLTQATQKSVLSLLYRTHNSDLTTKTVWLSCFQHSFAIWEIKQQELVGNKLWFRLNILQYVYKSMLHGTSWVSVKSPKLHITDGVTKIKNHVILTILLILSQYRVINAGSIYLLKQCKLP